MTRRLFAYPARLLFGAFLLSVLVIVHACSAADKSHPAAIASAHPLATQAGMDILGAGGNAFDAAVAVSAVLAVVEPYSSGIGGGGFWLLHRASDGFEVMVDGRERAPLAAHRDMYLDDAGNVIENLSVDGALAAGIPGEPAALVHIAGQYGRLPLARTLAPAIRLAREGFPVDEHYRRMAGFRLEALQEDAVAAGIFLDDDAVPDIGALIIQADLAETLEHIAQYGHNGFYTGAVAERLVAGVRALDGIWTMEDLAEYSVVERAPVRGKYHDYTVTSAAPPSSGGVALITMLNILSAYPLENMGEAERTHIMIEAMRRAYRDRAEFLGDTDFVDVPVERLTGMEHASALKGSIRTDRATPSASLDGPGMADGGSDTTHLSVLDAEGNRVAATLSINYPFGAAVVPSGTGVLLNDELDDFSAKPGVPNVYGLVGAEANSIEPGKRPLSSMSPTFVENEQGVAILGTPGGSRIITMVLLGILDFAEGNGPGSWVGLPRFHHQYLPDTVLYEANTFAVPTLETLTAMGHHLKQHASTWGNMQAIYLDKTTGKVSAASDPRVMGSAQVSGSGKHK